MKSKQVCKAVVDPSMTALLPMLMCYRLFGHAVHEVAGTALLILVVLHHSLSIQWAKNFFEGRYSTIRRFQVAVDLLLLVGIFIQTVTGMKLSAYVFPWFPDILRASLARQLHLMGSYWNFILMSVLIGLH